MFPNEVMIIRISKKANRNQLTCMRTDGSFTQSMAGPSLPHHDIAHFVAEKKLGIRNGFYGMIAQGRSIQELSDPQVIRTLRTEAWLAEIAARALQSLSAGACTTEQFPELVKTEAENYAGMILPELNEQLAALLLEEFRTLLEKWGELRDGETLQLKFPVAMPNKMST